MINIFLSAKRMWYDCFVINVIIFVKYVPFDFSIQLKGEQDTYLVRFISY